MADGTHISWAEATWNPITGCSVLSAGCKFCYAMKLAGTRLKNHSSRAGLTIPTKNGPVWNGKVHFNREWLDQPIRWRKPRLIFVVAHGDLFYEGVPDEWIDEIWRVMADCPQHTFIVLTKRTARARDYLRRFRPSPPQDGYITRDGVRSTERNGPLFRLKRWPLPNVWVGASVEDQPNADERIPELLQIPAALHWISAEPLLGPIDLTRVAFEPFHGGGTVRREFWTNALHGTTTTWEPHRRGGWGGAAPARLRWVVAGGESQNSDRLSHPDLFRSLRDQCQEAGVAFHMKQWGDWRPFTGIEPPTPREKQRWLAADGREFGASERECDQVERLERQAGKPLFQLMIKLGAKDAGRDLDGKIWDEFPERMAA